MLLLLIMLFQSHNHNETSMTSLLDTYATIVWYGGKSSDRQGAICDLLTLSL